MSCLFILCIYTKTVSIRIIGKHYIRILLLCKLKCKSKGFLILRIRIVEGCEVSIRLFLFLNYINLLKAKLLKHSLYRNISCSMERSVYDFKILCLFFNHFRAENELLKFSHILVIYIGANHMEKTSFYSLFFVHSLYIRKSC